MDTPRTALVLSGGGLVGGAWMVGVLHAIATETRWDPGSADIVIGTSAGSMIGAMITSAVPPWLLLAFGSGEKLEGVSEGDGGAQHLGATFRLHWSFPRPVLASPELALRSLREPWKYGPAGILAWLPRGVISTEPLKAAIRRFVPRGWADHRQLWVVAIDYDSGHRVVFGRGGAPQVDLSDAVAASCAIPGFYYPVKLRGRRYIDGGMYSASNLDLLLDTDVDLIVCLNPVSSRVRGGWFEPTGPIAALVRGDNRKLIDREVAALERLGKHVFLIEPQADDLMAMGFNYMSRRGLDRIVKTAVRTTTAALKGTALGRRLSALPSGHEDRLRRPETDPANWPDELFPPVRRTA